MFELHPVERINHNTVLARLHEEMPLRIRHSVQIHLLPTHIVEGTAQSEGSLREFRRNNGIAVHRSQALRENIWRHRGSRKTDEEANDEPCPIAHSDALSEI